MRTSFLTVALALSASGISAAKFSDNPESNLVALFETQKPKGWQKLEDQKPTVETKKDHMGLPVDHIREAPANPANQEIYFRLNRSGCLEIVVLESSKELTGQRPGLALMSGKTVFTRIHAVLRTAGTQTPKLVLRTRELKIIEEKPVGRPHLLDFLARLKWSAETLVFGTNDSLAQSNSTSRSAVFYANDPGRMTRSLPRSAQTASAVQSQSASRLLTLDFWQRIPLPEASALRNLLRQAVRL